MEIITGVAILALWLVALVLLMRGQAMIPVLVALAVSWAVITGAGPKVFKDVIDAGILGYASTVMVIIMGAWLSEVMMQTGIAETAIRGAAELAGDKPLAVAIAMIVVITFLFTSLYGVGAAVMVGVIALPIMLSMGIPAEVCAPAFIMSIVAGIQISLVEWGLFVNLFKIPGSFNEYFRLYVVQMVIWASCAILLVWVKLRRLGPVRAHSVNLDSGYEAREKGTNAGPSRKAPWYALLTPAVPVVGVMVFNWPLTAAFLVGVVFALLATIHHRPFRATLDLFQKAFYDGFRSMAPVCAVWLVIGCIIKASALPEVQAPLKVLLGGLIPTTKWGLAAFFIITAPLAVYRGPMCLTGVGSALVPMFLGGKFFQPGFLWATWKGAAYIHSSTDPINSWVLWTLGYLKVSGSTHIRTALPYTWLACALSTIAAILMIG
jgi:Gnt-I system high-affinity gluconate transporter